MKPARQFVQDMKLKHGANIVWVWDVLEEELNIIKGCNCVLDDEEIKYIEAIIIDGLN